LYVFSDHKKAKGKRKYPKRIFLLHKKATRKNTALLRIIPKVIRCNGSHTSYMVIILFCSQKMAFKKMKA